MNGSTVGREWFQGPSSIQTPDLLQEDRAKHVSFDTSLVRSNTIAGGIDSSSTEAYIGLQDEERRAASSLTTNLTLSNERLINVGLTTSPSPYPVTYCTENMVPYTPNPSACNSLRLIKRTTIVKTRATQTEAKTRSGKFKGSSKSVSDATPNQRPGSSQVEVRTRQDEAAQTSLSGSESLESLDYLMLSPRSRRRFISGKSLGRASGKVNYYYHKHSLSRKSSRTVERSGEEERRLSSGWQAEIEVTDLESKESQIERLNRKTEEMDEERIPDHVLGERGGSQDGEKSAVSLPLTAFASNAPSVQSTHSSARLTSQSQIHGPTDASVEFAPKPQKSDSQSIAKASHVPTTTWTAYSKPPVIQRQRSTPSAKSEKKRRREHLQSLKQFSYSSDDEEEEDRQPHRRHSVADAGLVICPETPHVNAGEDRSECLEDAGEQKEETERLIDRLVLQEKEYEAGDAGEKRYPHLKSSSSSSVSVSQVSEDRIPSQSTEQRKEIPPEKDASPDMDEEFFRTYDLPPPPLDAETTEHTAPGVTSDDLTKQHESLPAPDLVVDAGSEVTQSAETENQERHDAHREQEVQPHLWAGSLASPSSEETTSHLIELTSSPDEEMECEMGKESGSSVYATATDRTPGKSSSKTTPASTAAEKTTTTTTYETASSSLFSLFSSPASLSQRKSSQDSATDSHLSPTQTDAVPGQQKVCLFPLTNSTHKAGTLGSSSSAGPTFRLMV